MVALVNIYDEGELLQKATIKKYLIVQAEGTRQVSRPVEHDNPDATLAVAYHCRSLCIHAAPRVANHTHSMYDGIRTERRRRAMLPTHPMLRMNSSRMGTVNAFKASDARQSPSIRHMKLRVHPVVGQGTPVSPVNIDGGIVPRANHQIFQAK
jgi:hypothetical protein